MAFLYHALPVGVPRANDTWLAFAVDPVGLARQVERDADPAVLRSAADLVQFEREQERCLGLTRRDHSLASIL
ncbi:hypothetical protein D3C86_1013770 [compost metagenome]